MKLLIYAISAVVVLILFPLSGRAAIAKKPKHSLRYLVAIKTQRGLADTPLSGLGFVFEREAHRTGLSPFFLAGASGTESSVGRAGCSGNPKNVWGLGACNRYWTVPYFETWAEAIRYYASFIRSHWPTARSVYELHGYCECGSSVWGSRTSAWMSLLFGDRSGSILYPRAAT